MADYYLKEDGSGHYQLENGSGSYLLEQQSTPPGDDTSVRWANIPDGWFNPGIFSFNDELRIVAAATTRDDDFVALPPPRPLFQPQPAFSQNDEVVAQPVVTIGVDEDYWWAWCQKQYPLAVRAASDTDQYPTQPPPAAQSLADDSVTWIVLPDGLRVPLFTDTDELAVSPPATLGVDDDVWSQQTQRIGPVVVANADTDEYPTQPVVPINVDEDYWTAGWQSQYAVPVQSATDTDQYPIQPPPPAQSLDDTSVTWINIPDGGQVKLFLDTDDIGTPPTPFGLDEDYNWTANQYQYLPSVQAISSTDEIGTPPAPFGLDDDSWKVVVPQTVSLTIDMGGGNLGGPSIIPVQRFDDEIRHIRWTAWDAVPVVAFTFNDDIGTPPVPINIDEDYWWTAKQLQYQPSVQSATDTDEIGTPPPPAFDDEYWWTNQYTGYAVPVQAITDTDEWVFNIFIDEDYWWHNDYKPWVVPVQAQIDTDERYTPPVPINVDEDYWYVNSYAWVQYPQAITDDEIGTQLVAPPIPPEPPAEGPPRFGGGPFWRKYGYDSAYDAIRNQETSETSTARPGLDVPRVEHEPFTTEPKRGYRTTNQSVSLSVVGEMRKLWKEELTRQAQEEDEELKDIMDIIQLL